MPFVVFADTSPDENLKERPKESDHVATLPPPTQSDRPNSYPLLRLEVDKVNDVLASRIASSLLGHVLFTKNQIPLPVPQLARIPSRGNARALRHRTELLASFDTLVSHFDTTFSALAIALGRTRQGSRLYEDKTYVAILLGPSMGTAKTKVLLGIDGLEVKEGGEPSLDESAIKGRSQKEKTPIAPLGTNNFRDDGNQNKSGSDSASESDEDIDPGGPESSEDEDSEEDEDEDEDEDEGTSEGERGHLSLDGAENQEHPQMTYEEEQRFLKHAERQLSLTLAASDANDRGSELSPTQTHVLLRAPRTFAHPAWTPRQNMTKSLNLALLEFMNRSGLAAPTRNDAPQPRKPKARPIEGVWLTARDGLQYPPPLASDTSDDSGSNTLDEDTIWWSWDGKLAGFSDW